MSLRLQTTPSTSLQLSNETSCVLPTEVAFLCKNDCRTAEEPLTVPDLGRLAEGCVSESMFRFFPFPLSLCDRLGVEPGTRLVSGGPL